MAREMKDSGIEWIGKIPIEWEAKKNKSLFYEVNERCENGKEHTLLAVSEYYGIAPRSEKIQEGEYETRATTLDGYKICKCGDIVMNIMLAWKRSTARSGYDGIVSPAYCVFRKRSSDVDTKFFHYLFRTHICADMFKRYSTGIIDSRLRLYPDVFMQLYSIVPPISEQHRIADFLDRKCAEIDRVLEKTRASIEEYKKLKQSVITQAVTKGVRGEREMKDSGIEWFRQIPVDVNISRVGYYYNVILGKMICSQPQEGMTEYPYFCAANIHYSGIDYYNLKRMWFSSNEIETYAVRNGDLLVVEGGAGAGGCAIVKECNEVVGIQNSIQIVRPKHNHDIRYLAYLIQLLVKSQYIDVVCNKATIPHFTKDKLLTMPYLIFPINEQQEICNYLDKKCSEIDTLISKKEQFITELESYKKSLIYEYVTGKKEVQ